MVTFASFFNLNNRYVLDSSYNIIKRYSAIFLSAIRDWMFAQRVDRVPCLRKSSCSV